MRRRRIIHRADATQAALVAGLRRLGATVEIIGEPVDLLVGFRNQTYLVEVKTPRTIDDLTPQQCEFRSRWRGDPFRVWTSLDDALVALGLKR